MAIALVAARLERRRRRRVGSSPPMRATIRFRSTAIEEAVRGDPRGARARRADHRSRRLRRRRRHRDDDRRRGAARAWSRVRLADPRPHRRRLRPQRGDGPIARRARHRDDHHGRLRDHERRRGRPARRSSASGSSSPTTTSPRGGCPTARSSIRAWAAIRVPISAGPRSPTSWSALCSASSGPSATSTWSRWRQSPTWCRCTGENRSLVRRGLALARRAPRPGLRALMEACLGRAGAP